MGIFDDLLKDVQLPKFVKVNYNIETTSIEDPEKATRAALLSRGVLDRIKPGDSVCIAAGSREIANLSRIVKVVVDEVKNHGGKPFIIPAMGSHGGATAEGQAEILAGYGITEETMGVPIRSCMKTVEVGKTESGLSVQIDSYANEADCIIPIGRIKAHTDFRGPVESGLMKMIAIGIGKQHGASICHSRGFALMSQNIRDIAKVVIRNKPVAFGVAIIENAFHQTYKIVAIPGELIEEEEPKLLVEAKSLIPKIPFEKADALIVNEIGKNISGTGMDPNVTGRSAVMGRWEPNFDAIAVLDITEQSHNNCNGLGIADVTTERVFDKFSFEMTYPNAITSTEPISVKIPAVMPNDLLAIKFAIRMCYQAPTDGPRIVWIRNTLNMDTFFISESLISAAKDVKGLEVASVPMEIPFDEHGNFIGWDEAIRYADTL